MNNKGRSLFIVGIFLWIGFAFSPLAQAGFIYDLGIRTVKGKDIPDQSYSNLGEFEHFDVGFGASGLLIVSQLSQLDGSVISGSLSSQVHATTVNCESVQQNDLWINFRVPRDTPFRFSGTNSYRLQRTGNPLEEYCEGPLAYLFGITNGTPYIQNLIDFPFDGTGSATVNSVFDISGTFRSDGSHTLYVSLPTGARLGLGGTGAIYLTRTLQFSLVLIEAPTLEVNRSASGISVYWPTTAATYVLEAASSSAPNGTWSAVASPVTAANGMNSVNIGLAGANRFFRLRKIGP